MAITNAQQYKQLVNKPADNKRPGYRGDAAYGKTSGSEQAKSFSKATSRDSKPTKNDYQGSKGPSLGDGKASGTTVRYDPQKALDRATKVALEKPKGILNRIPSTIGIARKGINRLMKNQLEKNRIDYIKRNFPQYYDQEVGELVNLPAYLQGLVDDDKLYTDQGLKMIQNLGKAEGVESFEDFMFNVKGSPHLKFAGNVGGLGTRSAVRDADGNIIGYKFDNVDEFGNIIGTRGEGEGSNLLPPIVAQAPSITEQESEYVNPLSLLSSRIAGTQFAADGGRIGAMGGGIMNVEDLDREAFLLGGIAKGLKKAVRGVKKIIKSPLGKAALIGAGFGLAGMGPFKGLANTGFGKGLAGLRGTLLGQAGSRVGEAFVPYKEGLLTKLGLTKGGGSFMPTFKGGITLASILPLLAGKTDEEKDDILKDYYASQKLIPSTTSRQAGSEFDFYEYNLAEGGMPSKEPVAKKVMPLLDMDGMEKDYRAEGGFVPIGRMEKADDVPARLSKNEFVFTADAVRNAGEGDVDKGAEVMYNMMKNLEAGGEVSEESQGLDGAREMFQTSQRLGEVI